MKNTLNEQVSRIKNMMGLNEMFDKPSYNTPTNISEDISEKDSETPLVDLILFIKKLASKGIPKSHIEYAVKYVFDRDETKTSETDDQSSVDTPERSRTKEYPDYHGSPYDRGRADSYYGRAKDPHYYPEGTYQGEKITDLSDDELAAYYAGYEDNEKSGDKKDWGE